MRVRGLISRVAALSGATFLFAALVMCETPPHPEPSPADVYAALPPAQPARRYVVRRAPGPVVIDGDIRKPVWRDAGWTENFVDIEAISSRVRRCGPA